MPPQPYVVRERLLCLEEVTSQFEKLPGLTPETLTASFRDTLGLRARIATRRQSILQNSRAPWYSRVSSIRTLRTVAPSREDGTHGTGTGRNPGARSHPVRSG